MDVLSMLMSHRMAKRLNIFKMKTKLQLLLLEKEKIEYRLRYASRQGWATEIYKKELEINKKARISEASKINFETEYYSY